MTERFIHAETRVPVPREDVWDAWTTEKGLTSFFCPACRVKAEPDGPFEIYFRPGAPPGERGGDDLRVLAVQEPEMLSFTWNAPPSLPEVRAQRTAVVIRFETVAPGETRVTLHHTLWGKGGQWDEAFDYFERAWNDTIMPRLRWRFLHGPVDWSQPPTLEQLQSI